MSIVAREHVDAGDRLLVEHADDDAGDRSPTRASAMSSFAWPGRTSILPVAAACVGVDRALVRPGARRSSEYAPSFASTWLLAFAYCGRRTRCRTRHRRAARA